MKKIVIIAFAIAIALATKGTSPREPYFCSSTFWGMYWDGQKCENCQWGNAWQATYNCKCTQYNTCSQCPTGFFMDSGSGTCQLCDNGGYSGLVAACCSAGNNTFGSNPATSQNWATRASSCRSSWVDNPDDYLQVFTTSSPQLNGTISIQMYGSFCYSIQYCTQYTDYGTCTACQQGYYLNSTNMCSMCQVPQCKQCSQANDCSLCIDGWYLNSNDVPVLKNTTASDFTQVQQQASMCSQCNANCLCTDFTNLCSSCMSGYYMNSGSCTACLNNCAQCTTGTTCTQCQSRFVLSPDGTQCLVWPANCLSASASNNTMAYCTECANGYYLLNQICTTCTSKYDVNNNTAVDRCDQNQRLSCFQVQNETNLPPHQNDYYLVVYQNENVCIKNIFNCRQQLSGSALTNQSMLGKCASCYADLGHVLNSQAVCAPCPTGCSACVAGIAINNFNCTSCLNGYYLNAGQCTPCNPTANCMTCSNGQNCTACNTAGYYLQISDSTCKMCQTQGGCKTCTDGNTCSACFDGYGFDNSKVCQPCISDAFGQNNCQLCAANNSMCTKCQSGYTLITDNGGNFACEACDAYCQVCDGNRKQCSQCQMNYYVSNGACVPYRAGCITWSSDGTCTLCDYGMRLLSGYCFNCMDKGAGYINCPVDCTTDPSTSGGSYRRDGDLYTSSFNPDEEPGVTYGATLLMSVMTLLLSLILFV